jgi:hypothetical protein
MPSRPSRGAEDYYEQNVFINCPFDDGYLPLFRALIFAVCECGLRLRCAQEVYDAGEVRIEKIARIVRDWRWGIHDISRTSLNAQNRPRFNMPFELGLFVGARRFGCGKQARKSCLVMDREPYRYQAFLSDIAGQDIAAHGDDPQRAMKPVRDWFSVSRAGAARPAGAAVIGRRYALFLADLPSICAGAELDPVDLTFAEYADIVSTWLRRALAERGG